MMVNHTAISIIIYGFTKRSSRRVRTVHEIVAGVMAMMSRARKV